MTLNLPRTDSSYIKVILAPNAFKGSLKAQEFCRIVAEELESSCIHTISLPMCDGGDGTAEIIASYLGARPVSLISYDALRRSNHVTYYKAGDTVVTDLSSICGLKDLRPEEYDVMNANTAGLGIVLRDAVENGARKIILGIGGSASIDGGIGALQEMGLKLVSKDSAYRNHLLDIKSFDPQILKQKFKDTELILLCDVDNTLCGSEGAAMIFGPQKGASFSQVSLLDRKLAEYADLLSSESGLNVLDMRHGGAAGGVAASFAALLGAELVSGAEYCLQLAAFEKHLQDAQLVITGEGKLDIQSMCGKLPGVIASICDKKHIPVVAIAGIIEASLPLFNWVYALVDYAANLPDSLRQPSYYLRYAAKDVCKDIINMEFQNR